MVLNHSRSIRFVLAGLIVTAVAVWGWHEFWFLTDDAFIAFRHVANWVEGHGPTWNREPFVPVESCTSWLWVVIHAAIWWAIGIQAPDAVGVTSVLCMLGTLAVTASMCLRWLRRAEVRGAGYLTFAMLLALATQPTFLTWTNSGLESPLFILCVVTWLHIVTTPPDEQGSRWPLALASAAVVITLTRPDGLAFIGATLAVFVLRACSRTSDRRAIVIGCLPFLLIVEQFLLRHWYFGFWLPNTYYAKVVGPWPESGIRYLAAFALEHGVWLWMPVVLVAAAKAGLWRWREMWTQRLGLFVALGVLGFVVAYYSLRVGGDHFGFRVFALLVPPLFVTFVVGLARLNPHPVAIFAGLALFTVSTHTTHWTRHRAYWETATVKATDYDVDSLPRWRRQLLALPIADQGFVELSSRLPSLLGFVLQPLDRWNAWMEIHLVCLHRSVHIRAARRIMDGSPTRARGPAPDWSQRPVMDRNSIGFVGWTMPNVAIIDTLGLADRVVARHLPTGEPFPGVTIREFFEVYDKNLDDRIVETELNYRAALVVADANRDRELSFDEFNVAMSIVHGRRMAHDRAAPAGYIDAFRPNVRVEKGKLHIDPREQPLTDAEIREIERRFFLQAMQQ